jgi:hypothetical protein
MRDKKLQKMSFQQLEIRAILDKVLYVLILLFSTLIILRPLSFVTVGDFRVYLSGVAEVISNEKVYDPSRGNFGKRYFNGPLLAWLLSPFLMVPESLALFLFRTISLISTITLVWLVFRRKLVRREIFLIVIVTLLLFSSRMNMNLAQGASISALSGCAGIYLLLDNSLKSKTPTIFLSAFLLSITFNYKPQLSLIVLFYLCIILRKFKFSLYFIAINGFYELACVVSGRNATYLNWLELLLARSTRIAESGSQDIVGPYALIGALLQFPVQLTYLFPIAMVTILLAVRNHRQNISTAFWLLGIGTFLGPYSPAQDALLLSILFLKEVIARKSTIEGDRYQNSRSLAIFATFTLALQVLATENSFSNSMILGFCLAVIFRELELHLVRWRAFLIMAFISSLIPLYFKYDHIVYDIAGLSTFMMGIFGLWILHKKT